MNQVIVNYAAVRYLPYRETDEFVNVGVVIYCPSEDRFEFKFVNGSSTRVRRFFPEIQKDVLSSSLDTLKKGLAKHRRNFELGESSAPVTTKEIAVGLEVFKELVRPRESILHFSPPGTLMANSWKEALDTLFVRYTERKIASSPREQERLIHQRLMNFFQEWHVRGRYRANRRYGDSTAHATWNLLSIEKGSAGEVPLKGFKALSLDREDADSVYSTGAVWVEKIQRLRSHGFLPLTSVFTLRLPEQGTKFEAARDVMSQLRKENVEVITIEESGRLKELAGVSA